ncbi:YrhB domain-containing protein [Chitinophaga sp. Hz27]|uniref:YrhB domain-containing protein n=1 Tax=Chitinophaga sp. Hz27 TaxID=3347169 RepID=UPI0035DBDABE
MKIADNYLVELKQNSRYELAWLFDTPKEFEYGWVFFYQSKKFVETRNPMYGLGGNGPIIINKFDGSVRKLRSARNSAYYIDQYIKEIKEQNLIFKPYL